MADKNKATVEKFYTAFSNKDAKTMAECYAPTVNFEDPAFGKLVGQDAIDMWTMLCGRAADLKVEFKVGDNFTATSGSAHWEAYYTFSSTGNKVHNIIDATFTFNADGLITNHTDVFNFRAWASQALGLKGHLFGGFQWFHNKVTTQALAGLRSYQKKKQGAEQPAAAAASS